ncbi:ComF family protein [Oceanirhabdus sp. W0125-5]|uniref:ComF family protein n=1 Tax=Oceanirhabdus sp. W0125-5 TaxID=2999116 RepID=UPI0022F316AE|nr:phosphoribosyltransferase family protein [Oceanirhabdus sp. W0125-5]WBW98507.1 ComF family protein [Oceanirhabdus sp. W0125-5]
MKYTNFNGLFSLMRKKLTNYVDGFLSVLFYYEDMCIICNKQTNNNHILCDNCKNNKYSIKKTIKKGGFKFNAYCCYYYNKYIREAIKGMKYKNDFNAINAFGKDLANLIIKENLEVDIITFVPSNKSVIKKRDYNQSELLARKIVKSLNKQFHKKIYIGNLLEKEKCLDQIGLSRLERWENVSNVFSVNKKNKEKIKNRKIILIDDVLTSGATAYYCSKRLIEEGASSVDIVTIAAANII